MSTLIIPCLGRKIVNGLPQYLNFHPNGKLLIEYSIDGINKFQYDKILIVLLQEDDEKYDAISIIREKMKELPLDFLLIDKMTSGPAETVYFAIKNKDLDGQIVVKDVDNYLKIEDTYEGNFVAGLDLNTWNQDLYNLRDNSFLIVNEQKNILDIIEKKIKSDVICLGLYGFRYAKDFVKAYDRLNDYSYPISKLYISHVISYLIGYSNCVFHYVNSLIYESWGNEREWLDMQKKYTLYFINIDKLICKENLLHEYNINKLKKLQDKGASFVGYTVKNKEHKEDVLKIIEASGLKFIKIVYECPYSERQEIIVSPLELDRLVIEL